MAKNDPSITGKSVKELVALMRKGHRLSIARIITKIENRDSDLEALMTEMFPLTGNARIIGVTGPPGSGKSTLVDILIQKLRTKGKRVAVVAVDPSSPFTGGALLGDRIRMQSHHQDEGVYIRSLGTRGHHGGLSHATKEVVLSLDAAGFDYVIVETAGVGQTELEILKLADSILVLLVPESGDSIQVMKAGLMEIADIFAVNKSDRPESDILVKEIINMIGLNSHPEKNAWDIPVLKTEAVNDLGITEVLESLENHEKYLIDSGKMEKRKVRFLKSEVLDILREKLTEKVKADFESESGIKILENLMNRKLSPYDAAKKLDS